MACPQLPTTLPTLDELLGTDDVTVDNITERTLELTREPQPLGHVYTLRAELGARLAPVLERLLDGWRGQGYEVISLKDYMESLVFKDLPRHEIAAGEVPGRSGTLALQGREFLAGM